MNAELKREWVSELCSKEHAQGKGRLYSALSDSYCCLGVLATVIHPGNAPQGWYLDDGECGISKKDQEALADMNDCGVPFEVIAGFIQENL